MNEHPYSPERFGALAVGAEHLAGWVALHLVLGLPHELVESLLKRNSIEALTQQTDMDNITIAHLEKAKSELGMATTAPILGLGLWMDGVPCNWDRTDSLEVFSLNFPGISPLSH